MSENNTVLQSVSLDIQLEGVLAEKNLEIIKKDGVDVIKGDLSIQTDKEGLNVVKVGVYSSKLTKEKKESKVYTSLLTIMEEYKSIPEVGLEAATRISIKNGQASPNTFYGNNGLATNIQYRSNFFNRVKGELNEHAEFKNWKCYIKSTTPETVYNAETEEREETGRLLVNVLVPMEYSKCKIEPITLVVQEDMVDAFESTFTVGTTAFFDGDIVSSVKTTTKKIERQFGKSRIEESKKVINELIVTGGSPAEENEEFSSESIRNALSIRETAIKEMEEQFKNGSKSEVKTTTQTSGRTFGRGLNI